MTPQELKTSILKRAMEGKLVEQRSEEGTGESVLLAAIDERKLLIKAKVIKNENLAEISEDDIPFEIPENWIYTKLNNLVCKTIKRGKSPVYTPASSTLVFAQKCNVKTGGINMELAQFLDESKLSKYPDDEFMQDLDIVVNSTGNGTLGRIGMFHEDDNPRQLQIVPDSHVTVIRVCNAVSNEYIYYFLKYCQPYLESLGEGSTNQTELRPELLKNLIVGLPPLAEQKRIVAKIEELLPYIDRYEEAWTKLEEFNKKFPGDMQKSILQYAIQGKLVKQRPEEGTGEELYQMIQQEKQRLIKEKKIKKEKPLTDITEDEIPFDIPESWKWVRFSDIATFLNGDRGKNYPNKDEYVNEGVAWINTGHITLDGYLSKEKMNYITEEKYDSLRNGKIEKGDLVYCLRGATFGKVARIEPFDKGAIASSLMIIRLVDLNLREYIMLYLKSPIAFQQLHLYDNGSAQPNLAAKDVAKYMIPLPPIDEQKRIVAKINELLVLCGRLK